MSHYDLTLDPLSRLKGIETNYLIIAIKFHPCSFGSAFPFEGN